MIAFLLLVIVVVILGGLMLTGIGGFLGIWLASSESKDAKRALADASGILDRTFDGAPTATYQVTSRTLPFELVVQGGIERGYKLTAQQKTSDFSSSLVFEKV